MINTDKIVSIIKPDAAPIKRLVQHSKDNGTAFDATCGRKTKAVIITEGGYLVLSAITPETIATRINGTEANKGEANE